MFQIQNNRKFEKLKQRLLSEIEIVDHRVEWDPDKFQQYWKENSTEVCVDAEQLTEDQLESLVTFGGYYKEFGSLLQNKVQKGTGF